MVTPGQLIYDPLEVFLDVFSSPDTVARLGVELPCPELNALYAVLEAHERRAAAVALMLQHFDACDDLAWHLN